MAFNFFEFNPNFIHLFHVKFEMGLNVLKN